MIASEEPCVLVPVVSPGAWKSSASIRMQRCWISKVCGYSGWSMKLRWRLSSITRRASGSIQVVTKVARLRSGMPSTASSWPTRRIAAIAVIGSSGIAWSGAASVRKVPGAAIWGKSGASLTRPPHLRPDDLRCPVLTQIKSRFAPRSSRLRTESPHLIGESKIEEQLQRATERANKLIEKQIDADADALKREIEAAAKEDAAA
jgi:hypothetical protein